MRAAWFLVHNPLLLRLRRSFWFDVHNLIAHPLLLTRARWADRFHDWSAARM